MSIKIVLFIELKDDGSVDLKASPHEALPLSEMMNHLRGATLIPSLDLPAGVLNLRPALTLRNVPTNLNSALLLQERTDDFVRRQMRAKGNKQWHRFDPNRVSERKTRCGMTIFTPEHPDSLPPSGDRCRNCENAWERSQTNARRQTQIASNGSR